MPNLVDVYCARNGALVLIVGMKYTGYDIDKLRVDNKVILVKEPDNKSDPFAIKVLDSDTSEKIGYVASSHYWKDDHGIVLAKDLYPHFGDVSTGVLLPLLPSYIARTPICIKR